jgi:hypothetical protein
MNKLCNSTIDNLTWCDVQNRQRLSRHWHKLVGISAWYFHWNFLNGIGNGLVAVDAAVDKVDSRSLSSIRHRVVHSLEHLQYVDSLCHL